MKWVGGITCFLAWEGRYYLALVLGCCTEKAIGYAIADRSSLVCAVIDMAVRHCLMRKEQRFSIRAGLAASTTQRPSLNTLRVTAFSPPRAESQYAETNAWAESAGATLKNERVYQVYPARDKAIRDIASWTELEHGHTRLHSPLSHRHFWARPRRNSTQNKQPETRPSPPAHKIPNSPRLLPWMN